MKKILIAMTMLALGVLVQAQTIMPVPFLSRISGGDTTPNYLFSKLVAGTGITLTKNNPGANETITITSASGSFSTTTINGVATTTFTFSTSTTGTDFNISTTTNTIIFNLPTASALNRGALSSTDWSTFNNKQATVSGTYPIVVTGSVISTGFSTSTINSFSAKQTFTNASSTSFTGDTLYSNIYLGLNGTSTNWGTTRLNWANATGTNLFSTILAGTNGTTTNWGTTNLFATNAVFTSATTTNFNTTVANIGSSTTTNARITRVNADNSTTTNLSFTNATGTNLGITGLINTATSTVVGSLTVTGNIPNRVVGYTASSTITINVDTTDEATTTVNQTTTFANPTGTPIDGFMYLMTLTATGTRTVSWGNKFASSTDLSAPLTIASGTTEIIWKYDQFLAKYLLLGLLKTF